MVDEAWLDDLISTLRGRELVLAYFHGLILGLGARALCRALYDWPADEQVDDVTLASHMDAARAVLEAVEAASVGEQR